MLDLWLVLPLVSNSHVPPGELPVADDVAHDAWTFAGLELHGRVSVGWRFVSVDGSREQYDEDQNQDAGALLRELTLEGTRTDAKSAIESFLLSAHDVGDGQTSYRASLGTTALRANASFDRTKFTANDEGDIHSFDVTRDRARLRLELPSPKESELHGGLEFLYGKRDGFALETRNVDFGFVSGVPVHSEARTRGVGGDMGFEALGFDVAIDGGVDRLESRQNYDFEEPAPSDPGSLATEDFDADGTATTWRAGTRVRRDFDEHRLSTDFGFEYADTSGSNELDMFESGILFDPSDTFERQTNGDAEVSGRVWSVDAGARYAFSDAFALHARLSHSEDSDSGNLTTDTFFSELMSVPEEVIKEHEQKFESRLDLLEIGIETLLAPSVGLDLSLQAGRDEELILESIDGNPIHHFDDTLHQIGGEAQLSLEAASTCQLSFSGGYDIAPTNSPLSASELTFEDERGLFAAARVRWKPRSGVTLNASARHTARDIDAFGLDYDSDAFSIGASLAPTTRWSLDLSYTLRMLDYDGDTTKVFLVPFPAQLANEVEFTSTQNILSVAVGCEVAPQFKPRLVTSAVLTTGDNAMEYDGLLLDLPWQFAQHATLGTELDAHHFDARSAGHDDDYDSCALVVYAGFSF